MTRKSKAIFLDRDGIINVAIREGGLSRPPRSMDEFTITPGIAEPLKKLKENGYRLFIVTNQPDVANGKTTVELIDQFHNVIKKSIPEIDDIYVCYHKDSEQCTCRKPKPGMLQTAAEKYQIDLSQSFMVGDRWRDVGAGKNAGCKSILVDYSYSEEMKFTPDFKFQSVPEALHFILSN